MDKLLTFEGYDSRSGPHIFPIEPDVNRSIGHIKMARPLPSEIEQYIRTAKPIDGKTQLLIDAMGASEFFGSNSNGDAFPEEALRHEGKDYGHQTFTHYGKLFKHHVNKDPARAYGDVALSAYDPAMHRVLLIVHADNAKCADITGQIAQGNYPAVSMGARVPFDRCSVCNNKAKNRSEYCDHLKYQMNKILPDGRRVMAINDFPKFFDISIVLIGAEKAAFVLKKVASAAAAPSRIMSSAEAGELYFGKLGGTKTGVEKKTADITKEVPGVEPTKVVPITAETKDRIAELMDDAGDVKGDECPIPDDVLDRVGGFPLRDIFSTLAALGIDLRPQDFQRITLVSLGHKPLADKLASQHLVFNEAHIGGPVPPWAAGLDQLDVGAVNEKLAFLLQPYVAERSVYPEILLERLGRMEKRASADHGSQWYPMDSEQKRKSSGISGLVPASLALSTGFMMLRKLFPQMAKEGPLPLRVLARHPWLLPILMAAGVGTSVGVSRLTAQQPIGEHGTGRGLDGMEGGVYDGVKTASISSPLARFGLIPLTYLYAGVQQRRWERGERLSGVDRLIARRPDLAALASFMAAPHAAKGLRSLVKKGSLAGDVALYTVGTTSKLMPAVITGAILDSLIFRGIQRLASRKAKGPIDHADLG